MLDYKKLKRNRRKFLALTGLTDKEFKELWPEFNKAYQQPDENNKTLAGRKRQRKIGGGRKGMLQSAEPR